MREIGSEFWETNREGQERRSEPNTVYLLSGRTALDFIIRDIKAMRTFSKVMLPSYCCDSMIEPFIHNGIEIQFYPVSENKISYPVNNAEAVLLIDYFGYVNPQNEEIARLGQQQGKIVIYDATHKLNGTHIHVDYSFCSYRKWTYCNFASVSKRCGTFNITSPTVTNGQYIKKRDEAAKLKAEYMAGRTKDKSRFLAMFAEAEELLDRDYFEYYGLPACIETDYIVKRRRENAEYLIDELKNVPGIRLWKENLSQEDTPLFVPVFVENGKRDDLRKFLTQNNIYCPIHWPLTDKHGGFRELYHEELSLICDQRYTPEDMDREIAMINSFLRR